MVLRLMLQQNVSNKETAVITRLHVPSHGSLGSQEQLRREEGAAAAVAGIPEGRSPAVGSHLVLAQHQIQADRGSRPAVGTPGGHTDLVGDILVARGRLEAGNQAAGRSLSSPVVGTQDAAGVAGLEERSGRVDLVADQEEHQRLECRVVAEHRQPEQVPHQLDQELHRLAPTHHQEPGRLLAQQTP